MKLNKKNIIIIVFILIWACMTLLIYKYDKKNTTPQYIVINKDIYWKYLKKEWTSYDYYIDYDKISQEVNWKKFDIYSNNTYINTLNYITREFKNYYFDDDNNSVEVSDNRIMLLNKTYFSLIKYSEDEIQDNLNDKFINIFEKNNININEIVYQKKYSISEKEKIYIYSNVGNKSKENPYYIIIYQINNKNYIIKYDKEKFEKEYVNEMIDFKLYSILDISKFKNNLIFEYKCNEETCYDMWQYKKGKYELVAGKIKNGIQN